MNVLLLHPPLARRSYTEFSLRAEPLAHLVLGGALRRAGHAVRVIDLRVTPRLERELAGFAPDVAGFAPDVAGFQPDVALVSVHTLTHGSLDATLARLRRRHPRIPVLLFADAEYGNDHVVLRPGDFFHPQADALAAHTFLAFLLAALLPAVDCIAAGGRLASVPGLWVRSGAEWTRSPELAIRVGDYGVPDRGLLGRARGKYMFGGLHGTAFLFTTFGCRFKCRYCTMSKFTGPIHERRMDDTVAELLAMSEERVFLSDFEPFQAPEHMARLADAIESHGIEKRFYMMTRADSALEHEGLVRRWQALGLDWLYLGLDGHSTERLREMRKGQTLDVNERALRAMEALGLFVTVGFLVRPDFSRADFAELRAYVKRLRPRAFGFSVETPLVGTTFHDENESRLTTRDWSLFDLQHAVLPTRLPLAEFYRELAGLQLMALRMSTPLVMRAMPFADKLKSARVVLPRLLGVRRAARDHVAGRKPRAQPPVTPVGRAGLSEMNSQVG